MFLIIYTSRKSRTNIKMIIVSLRRRCQENKGDGGREVGPGWLISGIVVDISIYTVWRHK